MLVRLSLLIWGVLLAVLLLGLCLSPSYVYYQGPHSAHFNGRNFTHPAYNSRPEPLDVLWWQLTRTPGAWPASATLARRDVPPLRHPGDDIRLTLIGHSSVLLQFSGLNVITDPLLNGRMTLVPGVVNINSVSAPGIDIDDLPPIDIVLISHDHPDHLDINSLRQLWQRDQPLILTPLGVDQRINQQIPGINTRSLDWWHDFQFQGEDNDEALDLTLVPARHWSGRGLLDHNRTLWGGWVMQTRRGSIYFAGDSGYSPILMQQLARRFAPIRLALLPIGGYAPADLMNSQNMNPQQALASHIQLGAQRSVAIHHAAFPLTDEAYRQPSRELLQARRAAGIDEAAFLLPDPGESVQLP